MDLCAMVKSGFSHQINGGCFLYFDIMLTDISIRSTIKFFSVALNLECLKSVPLFLSPSLSSEVMGKGKLVVIKGGGCANNTLWVVLLWVRRRVGSHFSARPDLKEQLRPMMTHSSLVGVPTSPTYLVAELFI